MDLSSLSSKKREEDIDKEKVTRLIQEGLTADQIALKVNVGSIVIRRWAKKHRMGKQLDANEGCSTRQATPEELAAASAAPKRPKHREKNRIRAAYEIVIEDLSAEKEELQKVTAFLCGRMKNRDGKVDG